MTEVQPFHRLSRPVEAMQFRLGKTRRSQILEFCPRANVGVGSQRTSLGHELDELDIRWLQIPTGPWAKFVDVVDGAWIVKDGSVHYVHGDLEFRLLFGVGSGAA